MMGIASFVSKLIRKAKVKAMYFRDDYMDAYRNHTNERVSKNPHDAIGGNWDEVGQLQFDFLKTQGLEPSHTMLDIGCGTLRGGRHVIRFLEPEHYVGFDISPKAIEAAEDLLKREVLEDKKPRLFVASTTEPMFHGADDRKYDFLLAQSVFTHLPQDKIEDCFRRLHKVMHEGSRFFFTFHQAQKFTRRSVKDFSQPRSFFENLAKQHGLILRHHTYKHPLGQQMLEVSRRP